MKKKKRQTKTVKKIRKSENEKKGAEGDDWRKQEPILAIRFARNAFLNRRNGLTDGLTLL